MELLEGAVSDFISNPVYPTPDPSLAIPLYHKGNHREGLMYGGVLSGGLTMGLFSALRVYRPSKCLPIQSHQGTPKGTHIGYTLKWVVVFFRDLQIETNEYKVKQGKAVYSNG